MAMKQHPFVVTTTLKGDGTTIVYDKNKPNRSDAVGKAYKINASGKAELVGDGDEIDGKVLSVDPENNITGAYKFGGLSFLIGDGETVTVGSKVVGALGPASAKGYIKDAPALPNNLADVAAADIDAFGEVRTAHNAVRQALNALSGNAKGSGKVLKKTTTEALVVL